MPRVEGLAERIEKVIGGPEEANIEPEGASMNPWDGATMGQCRPARGSFLRPGLPKARERGVAAVFKGLKEWLASHLGFGPSRARLGQRCS
jgi:hypothetical protein